MFNIKLSAKSISIIVISGILLLALVVVGLTFFLKKRRANNEKVLKGKISELTPEELELQKRIGEEIKQREEEVGQTAATNMRQSCFPKVIHLGMKAFLKPSGNGILSYPHPTAKIQYLDRSQDDYHYSAVFVKGGQIYEIDGQSLRLEPKANSPKQNSEYVEIKYENGDIKRFSIRIPNFPGMNKSENQYIGVWDFQLGYANLDDPTEFLFATLQGFYTFRISENTLLVNEIRLPFEPAFLQLSQQQSGRVFTPEELGKGGNFISVKITPIHKVTDFGSVNSVNSVSKNGK